MWGAWPTSGQPSCRSRVRSGCRTRARWSWNAREAACVRPESNARRSWVSRAKAAVRLHDIDEASHSRHG
eukprot:6492311-Pyramimonas_sp.AAC.1